ncbi:MAG: hypothetical protein JNK76_18230 [Planctomycetales bacterium]|nr:hypothetical protein [Planctomycetales bacterium]MBN8628236.1 hypothetical protein [Planctomycetota bacterium]
MNLKINLGKGAGDLTFGNARADVRSRLGKLSLSTKAQEPENDFYSHDGLILGYDAEDKLEFIEVFPPSGIHYHDVNFFEERLPNLLERLASLGLTLVEQSGGYRCPEGIAIFCPRGHVESVSVFREGYYD